MAPRTTGAAWHGTDALIPPAPDAARGVAQSHQQALGPVARTIDTQAADPAAVSRRE